MANQPTKYRKFLAGAASAALVATAVVPTALAAELTDIKGNTHEAAIKSLVEKGIISGYPDGTFQPNKDLTRSDVVKLLGKWLETLGAKVPADYKTVQRFDDVPVTANEELVKYAALVKDNGVFVGSNGKLLAADKISRENMALVLVRAFDAVNKTEIVKYVNAQTFTKEVTDLAAAKEEARDAINVLDFFNITTVTTFNPKGNVTRGQFSTFLNNVIKTEVPTTGATKVVSVSATNLKEIVVAFDGTVDKADAEDADNYSTTAGAIDFAELSEDGKSVTLTLGQESNGTEIKMTNQKKYKVSVTNVKAGDKEVSVKDFEFSPLDNTLPTASKVVTLGNKAVKIVMSEPVKDAKSSNFTIDGKAFYGTVTTDGKEIVLKPYDASVLSIGAHKINVSLVEDYSTLKSLATDFDFTVVEDKEGPTVTETTATLEKVTLTFSEDIDPSTVSAGDVSWKSGTTVHKASSFTKVAGNKYVFEFTGTHKLPGYETTLYIDSVSDYSGNANATKEVKVTATVDQTRPEVTDVRVSSSDKSKVVVKFNKTVKADDKKYYTVTNADGDKLTIAAVKQLDSKSVELDLVNDLAGTNTLKISGIKDTTTLENQMLEYTTELKVGDTTGPSISSVTASASQRQVLITFNEKMDLSTLSNPANYLMTFDGSSRPLTDDVSITPTSDGKAVILTFPEEINKKDVVISSTRKADGTVDFTGATLTKIQVMNVKDVAGNLYDGVVSGMRDVISEAADLVANYNSSYTGSAALLTDQRTIKVKFTQPIIDADANDFELAGADIESVTADGTSTVTIKFEDDLGTTVTGLDLEIVAGHDIKTVSGNGLVDFNGAAADVDHDVTLADAVKPLVDTKGKKLKLETVNGKDTAYLTFSEVLEETASDRYAADLVVYADSDLNTALTPHKDYQTNVVAGSSEIVITFTNSDTGYVVEVDGARFIQDTTGNLAVDSEEFDTGVKVAGINNAVLNTAVTAAQLKHDGATEGLANGNYATGSKATYLTAINAAKAVLNNAASTQAQLDSAVTTLATATSDFEATKVVVSLTALTNAITAATTKEGLAVEGAGAGEYDAGAKVAFQAAIAAATTVKNNPASTQVQVNQAVTDLGTAEGTFDLAKN
ncbi:S-layer homology domain-containing protein [Psychrobacillus sp. FSL H8-0484]|uniref:S-layer homology domain-containing protein n=1 Tax=Psychrobacillus sp. FSL H8-0484 TaxID=2921390 RepID=UPI0030F699CE